MIKGSLFLGYILSDIVSGCIGIIKSSQQSTVNSQQSTVNNHSGATGIDMNSRSVPPVSAARARRSLLQTIQTIDIVVRGAKNGKP